MSDLVGNPEDRFSRVEAQMYSPEVELLIPAKFVQWSSAVVFAGVAGQHSS